MAPLAIGAMVPDIAYFVALRPTPSAGHSVTGTFTQSLLAGLVLWGIWLTLTGPALHAILPDPIASRWRPELAPRAPGAWLLAPIAIVMGAFTHIFWDSFTHHTGWGVHQLPWLSTRVGPFELYRWNQYLGGIAGGVALLAVMAHALWKAPVEPLEMQRPSNPFKALAWVVIALAGLATCVHAAWVEPFRIQATLVRAVIGAVSGGAAGWLFVAVVWRAWATLLTPRRT